MMTPVRARGLRVCSLRKFGRSVDILVHRSQMQKFEHSPAVSARSGITMQHG